MSRNVFVCVRRIKNDVNDCGMANSVCRQWRATRISSCCLCNFVKVTFHLSSLDSSSSSLKKEVRASGKIFINHSQVNVSFSVNKCNPSCLWNFTQAPRGGSYSHGGQRNKKRGRVNYNAQHFLHNPKLLQWELGVRGKRKPLTSPLTGPSCIVRGTVAPN